MQARWAICNETFQEWPVDRAFAEAREAGYTGIEIAPFTLGDDATAISAETRREVRSAARRHDLEVVGLHWLLARTSGYYLTSPDAATRRKTADYFRHLAELCRDLGGRILVLGSPQQRNVLPGISHDDAVGYAQDVIERVLPAFDETDVVLAIEPLGPPESTFLTTADAARTLIDRLDHPRVRLHLDVKAMSTEGVPIDSIIRAHAGRLVHFHANDANLRGPGMGDVDFRPILAALRDVGYSGWISVEVFDYEPGIRALVHDSIQYLQAVWASLDDES